MNCQSQSSLTVQINNIIIVRGLYKVLKTVDFPFEHSLKIIVYSYIENDITDCGRVQRQVISRKNCWEQYELIAI